MKFNPFTQELFTDKSEPIKQLSCPYKLNWDEMVVDGSVSRSCSICANSVIDTALLTDKEALALSTRNPKVCFSINPDQENIEIITGAKKITI